jgi:hypothetical protein
MGVCVCLHEAVEDHLSFPAVNSETCSLEPGQALSVLSNKASMHQMIGGTPGQDIPVVYLHVKAAVGPKVGLL